MIWAGCPSFINTVHSSTNTITGKPDFIVSMKFCYQLNLWMGYRLYGIHIEFFLQDCTCFFEGLCQLSCQLKGLTEDLT